VTFHPDKVKAKLEDLIRRKALELGRCVQACFPRAPGGDLTLEAATVLADLRKFAKLGTHKQHSFLRDLTGRIDPLSMARIEGRREVVNRLLDFLELDPSEVRALVEVDNGRE
jgi:DNA-directed RNA polymerase subunit F